MSRHAPDFATQHFARDDLRLALDQIEQQIEFTWREGNFLRAAIDPAALGVEDKITDSPPQTLAAPAAETGRELTHFPVLETRGGFQRKFPSTSFRRRAAPNARRTGGMPVSRKPQLWE